MSTDETPVGWLPSIDEWFDYVFDSEDGHELDFSPSNSDRELSQEDLEEWNQMNVTEDENGYPGDDPNTNDLEKWHHNQNDAWGEGEAQADAEVAESIGTIAPEDKTPLAKTIKDGIDRCKKAMENSSAKLEQDIEDANQSFHVEIGLMNEWHERIKAQDLILDKRKEIHVRLPTNQVVTPAHNALVDEDAKEANIRAKLASQVEKAEDAYRKDSVTLSTQIKCLRNVAELSGVDLDTGFDEYIFCEPVAPVFGVQSSTQIQGSSSTRPKQSNTANVHKRYKPTVPVVNIVEEDCANCGRLQEELSTAHRKIDRIQAAAPVPDMRKFIRHGEQILSELVHQHDSADEAATKELEDKKLSTEAALNDLIYEHARIKKIHIGIGHLWEHENQGLWQETFDLCREELVRIKKKQQAPENHDFRCDEKVNKRQWNSKELLVKQIKFYDSLLSLARSHVVNRWEI